MKSKIKPLATAALLVLLAAATVSAPAFGATKPVDEPGKAAGFAIRDCIDVPNRDIGRGDSGNYVREVQCLLNWAIRPSTYHDIAVDGSFGPDTEGKVRKFQQCANAYGAGLAVDGRVGPKTAPHLESWAASTAYVC